MAHDSSRTMAHSFANSSRLTINPAALEDMDTEELRAVGLGYNYNALMEQVKTILSGAIQKVLPFFEDEPQSSSKGRTPTGRPRYSMDTACSIELDKVLREFEEQKKPAAKAVETAQFHCEMAREEARKVDLYVLTLDAILAEFVAGPESKGVPAPSVSQNTVPSKSGAKEPASLRRTGVPQSSIGAWKQAANAAIGLSNRPKVVKPKAPPPKPLPRPVSEEEFEGVSILIRGKVKLADVNKAYTVLYDAFYNENMEKIKLSEMVKRGIAVSGMTEKAKFKRITRRRAARKASSRRLQSARRAGSRSRSARRGRSTRTKRSRTRKARRTVKKMGKRRAASHRGAKRGTRRVRRSGSP